MRVCATDKEHKERVVTSFFFLQGAVTKINVSKESKNRSIH